MKRYYNLGLDIFFEKDYEDNIFAYLFKDGKLETRNYVSDNILLLAEEVKEWEYKKMLERRETSKPMNTKIARKEMSVKERVVKIREILKTKKKLAFEELFDDFSKPYVVVTFLSILEMVKGREINIKQDGNFGEIYLERVD